MEAWLALFIGVMAGSGVYLLLRARTFDVVLGMTLLSYAVNVFIFVTGRVAINKSAIIDGARAAVAGAVCRSAAAGAGADRDRHQLRDDGAAAGHRPAGARRDRK